MSLSSLLSFHFLCLSVPYKTAFHSFALLFFFFVNCTLTVWPTDKSPFSITNRLSTKSFVFLYFPSSVHLRSTVFGILSLSEQAFCCIVVRYFRASFYNSNLKNSPKKCYCISGLRQSNASLSLLGRAVFIKAVSQLTHVRLQDRLVIITQKLTWQ